MKIVTIGRCGCCGGDLPLLDDDNDCDYPTRTGGECPGWITSEGWCGSVDARRIDGWIRRNGGIACDADT